MEDKNRSMEFRANLDIRLPRVRLIDAQGTNHGVIDTRQALSMARDQGLDLVQVAPPDREKIPTCKIMNLGKHKYDLSKKKKEQDKKVRQTQSDTKELVFRFVTDLHDLQIKAKQAEEFLKNGDRVKVTIKLISRAKGAQGRRVYDSNRQVGMETLNKFMELLPDYTHKMMVSEDSKQIIFCINPK